MSSLVVRDAFIDDVAAMIEVERTGYQFPWSENVFKDCFKPSYFTLLLLEQENVIGFAIVSNIVGEAHLLNICIHSDYYRQGHATLLLNAVIRRSMKEKCESILLEVRESNNSGVGLYDKFGFDRIGRRKNYYPTDDGREDALMYQLPIKEQSINEYI